MFCLHHALHQLPTFFERSKQTGCFSLPGGYYTPGYVAALAAFFCDKGITAADFQCTDHYVRGYFSAIGLSRALWGNDDYLKGRVNAGANYAPLTALSTQEDVDAATASINSCLRTMARQGRDYTGSPAFSELQMVVGELHDNVWSHGRNTGFSTAQRRRVANEDDYELEFSLADCGIGFLNELKRTRISGIISHQDAIEWCIKEGNSSKLANARDEWAQSVPEDFSGAVPFGSGVEVFEAKPNNHQGLGLAKLMSLAKAHRGELYLASGDCVMHLDVNGTTSFSSVPNVWKGVAISLSLRESRLEEAKLSPDSSAIEQLMNILRG